MILADFAELSVENPSFTTLLVTSTHQAAFLRVSHVRVRARAHDATIALQRLSIQCGRLSRNLLWRGFSPSQKYRLETSVYQGKPSKFATFWRATPLCRIAAPISKSR
jgi:hypothetical protein